MNSQDAERVLEQYCLFKGWHSEHFVTMFFGYLTASVMKKVNIACPRCEGYKLPEPGEFMAIWDEFKKEMGKLNDRQG